MITLLLGAAFPVIVGVPLLIVCPSEILVTPAVIAIEGVGVGVVVAARVVFVGVGVNVADGY